MDILEATRALSALSQETRLQTFRLLVRAGDAGMPAGDIARDLDVPQNTLSAHLSVLSAAGLVAGTRDGRSIIYRVEQAGMRALLSFLLEDCCGGRPELCAPLLDSVGCCPQEMEPCS
ncbi:MAG: transcriptional regulator [Alphaproteobacteria bacterium]|nr:MAG: transcriptional regulator [Alphaproteobacteria bacterium]